ncbi:MAG: ComEC family competence protein [Candidatus Omnitrophica bacterium]|nr:ComEC family competence protein [Candidatus Omnitrophota bacterium]
MNKPLPIAFVILIAGIAFARHVPIPFTAAIILAAFLFITFFCFKNKRNLIFYIICSLLVLILGAASYINYNYLPPDDITRLLKEEPAEYYIKGIVRSSPEYRWSRWGKRRCSFVFKPSAYKNKAAWAGLSGLCRLEIRDNDKDYSFGDIIVLCGKLKAPSKAASPGKFDYSRYLKTKGIRTLIDVRDDDNITVIPPGSVGIRRTIYDARQKIGAIINRYLNSYDGAVLNAMLIGKRSAVPKDLKDDFIKTGTVHVLSISGLHVAIISAILFFILRLMRIARRPSSILLILFLLVYAVLAGSRPPIIRATIMIIIYLLGNILERDFDIYSSLSLAGIIMLLVNPMQIFAAGFMLSFACVFSICYLTPKLESLFKTGTKNPIARYISKIAFASLAVFIGIAPLTAYFFKIVSPISIIANIFIVPLLGAVLLCGIWLVISGAFLAIAAPYIAYLLHILLLIFTKIAAFFAVIPLGHFTVQRIPIYAIAVYYIMIFALARKR